MKTKVLFLLALTSLISFSSLAQRSNIRIGYIDTEYILENVPEYQDATVQLDDKVQRWKTEIEERLSKVEQKKQQLSSESVLLTKELIAERQEEIDIEENEILDYQQKRFGPNGDLMIQRKQLMQPVQDQIFTAVQEIATNRNYDFIFDKSADVVMLYSADRFDISEQVLRSITRSSKRRQVQNKKERKAAEDEELIPEINEEREAREQDLQDKKKAREEEIEARRNAQIEAREQKKQEIEAKRQKILEERAMAREEKLKEREAAKGKKDVDSTAKKAGDKAEPVKDAKTEEPPKKLSAKEARKKALEEKKKKILEAREKARKEKLEAQKKKDSSGL
ncbi:MAG: OmpH family outer membrane protein [Flavobacteriaceae bacterium]|nr:OmpH family outer membrane protein [Bacteroidia bacterium]MBT8288795.1 OmpH family outer membrane protein [Bacteroidia bacterium]NNF75685.1 OmpH family outer membrane protein [Flavobacteriaceae bacterium]NNK73901.1 OmpH family outer membrane protein [Flavobacteriaceae bacterium]